MKKLVPVLLALAVLAPLPAGAHGASSTIPYLSYPTSTSLTYFASAGTSEPHPGIQIVGAVDRRLPGGTWSYTGSSYQRRCTGGGVTSCGSPPQTIARNCRYQYRVRSFGWALLNDGSLGHPLTGNATTRNATC